MRLEPIPVLHGKRVLVLCAVGLLLAAPSTAKAETKLTSKDIGCATVASERAEAICRAVADHLHWAWFGHATIAPGYKPDFEGVAAAYCQAGITAKDKEILQKLAQPGAAMDWRLGSAAEWLSRLLAAETGDGDSDNSIFNPKSPDYPLRHGCAVSKP